MTGTSPWYWSDPECDHWAVGLVACVGDNGRVHYVRVARHGMVPACGRHINGLQVLDGPKVVQCRICCFVARRRRNRIEQRWVQNILQNNSRSNWIARERLRNPRWLTPKEFDV